MRQSILFYASIASFFGALFLVALSIGLISSGNAGYGLVTLVLGVPITLGLCVVFDYVKSRMELTEDPDLDVDVIKPRFTKFGGG